MSTIDEFKQKSRQIKEREFNKLPCNALNKVGNELDATINFRVNSGLKTEFERVCKENHTNIARELKRFMTEVVRTETLL